MFLIFSMPSQAEFVIEVKYKLQKLMQLLPERGTDIFFSAIKRCMEKFWYEERHQSGLQDWYYTWVMTNMDDTIANNIIKREVMPLLEEAKSNLERYPAVAGHFQSLYSYIQKQFSMTTQAPSIPTPQVTHNGASPVSNDIESLHQQVRGLVSQISALESAIKGFYIKNAAYDTAIATLQTQTDQLPQILQRLEKLETPVKPAKSWFSRTTKSSSPAEMRILLQKMNDLNA